MPPERQVDPGGRDGCRAPIPWDRGPCARLAHRRPVAAVAAGRRRPQRRGRCGPTTARSCTSTAGCSTPVATPRRCGSASSVLLDAPDGVLCWARTLGRRPATRPRELHRRSRSMRRRRAGSWTVEIASDGGGEGEPYRGRPRARPGRPPGACQRSWDIGPPGRTLSQESRSVAERRVDRAEQRSRLPRTAARSR